MIEVKSNWKAELKGMHLEHIRQTAPGFYELSGGKDYKVKKYSDKTANQLTNSIIAYITFKGGYANRINSQGQARKERIKLAFGNFRDNIKYTPGTTNKGTGDIHSIINGRHLTIEVKIGNDTLSPNQIKEQQRITNAGGLYLVAKNMESFVTYYKTTFENA